MIVEQSFREGTLCLEEIVSSSRSAEPDMLVVSPVRSPSLSKYARKGQTEEEHL